MTLSEARDELRARGFDGLTDDRCDIFLNAGKNALEDYAPWPWLDASMTGTAPLTITDLKAVRHVWNSGSGLPLRGAERDYLRGQYGPDLTTTGTSEWWYLTGVSVLSVYPADTSSTFAVDYIKTSPELDDDTDEPLHPERLNQVWIDLSAVEAYIDADEPEMAAAIQQKAERRLAFAVGVYFGRNLQNGQDQALSFTSLDW